MAKTTKLNRRTVALIAIGVISTLGAVASNRFFAAPPPPPPVAQAPAPIPQPPRIDPTVVAEVLVAKQDIVVGQRLAADALGWQHWPKAYLPPNAITREQFPDAINGMVNTAARIAILTGDTVREAKVIRANDQSGLLAAMLPPGWRAIAIRLDPSGASSSGNFILPGDRVDILTAPQGARTGAEGVQVLLTNVKVIAINQALAAQPGQAAIGGQTATLMLSPEDAIKVAEAERQGRLSLALRATADTPHASDQLSESRKDATSKSQGRSVETLRFGMAGR